jgi:phosphopantothenoylcysteine decarboxylase/phosphopantothenate--cysteine ligase
MLAQARELFAKVKLAIFSAAVSDYRPAEVYSQKVKKEQGGLAQINLVENPDILKTLAATKREGQKVVGFALETENARENALKKLSTKNCDWIVLNQPDQKERGFGHDTNEVQMLSQDGHSIALELKSKRELAHEILDILIAHNF